MTSRSRDTIFSESFLNKKSPTKHYKKREFDTISKFTGLTIPPREDPDLFKPRSSTHTQRNLEVSKPYYTPFTTTSKGKGEFWKDPMNQSIDVNLLGIQNPKKHFTKTDNIKSYVVAPQSARFMPSTEKHERVKGYMNSDQIRNTLAQDHAKYYRGLLG